MSYILDALKKLENEKTSKNRGTGMLSISGELYKDERRHPSGGNIWKVAVVVVVASLLTFGATWFFLKTDQTRNGAQPHLAATALPAKPASTVAPQAPLVAPPAPAAVHQVVGTVEPVVKETVPSAVNLRSKRQNISKKKVSISSQQAQPVVSTMPPPSDISVSGIAWQDEHRARRAVVNGFLVQEGGSVSGAKIAEIYPDRVRFSQSGRFFEVYLLATGYPGTAK